MFVITNGDMKVHEKELDLCYFYKHFVEVRDYAYTSAVITKKIIQFF